ncbi:hypothetical protein EVAR_40474_1 [Eumeta japonica]|uniref:Nuclear receptor coactivator 6 TRADD-N domain-containing protein n=1 Tax=Eumeta variegata TaxID=151549 RepID=A0A4C1XX74_EUMVA|nr:hypothetical protein EVAR_40474_1 [Eumeta japonica]
MAADSDGPGEAGGGGGEGDAACGVVVTCEGDLRDPRFPTRLAHLLGELSALLPDTQPHNITVNKVTDPLTTILVFEPTDQIKLKVVDKA